MMCRCCRNAATLKRCALPRGARASRMAGVQNSARHRPLHPVHPQCNSHSAAHFQAISVVKSATSTCFEYIRVYGSTLELFHVASTVITVSSYRSSLPQGTSYSASLSDVSGGWIISGQQINISEFSTIDNQNCKSCRSTVWIRPYRTIEVIASTKARTHRLLDLSFNCVYIQLNNSLQTVQCFAITLLYFFLFMFRAMWRYWQHTTNRPLKNKNTILLRKYLPRSFLVDWD